MRKRNIVIELTSLLDVILIILFMVLVSMQDTTTAKEAELQAAIDAAGQAQASAEEIQEKAEGIITSYEMMNDNCEVVSISINRGRVLSVVWDEREENIEMTWENDTYVKNAFSLAIENALKDSSESGKQAVFLMFHYDSKAIYNADYRRVRTIMNEFASENVYIAEYDVRK